MTFYCDFKYLGCIGCYVCEERAWENCAVVRMISLNDLQAVTPLTISLASWILSTCSEILSASERDALDAAVQQAMAAATLENTKLNDVDTNYRSDNRGPPSVPKPPSVEHLKLYTDYDYLVRLTIPRKFTLVETPDEADYLFLVNNVKNFYSIHQRVSQFPYEGGLVRKDLLPLTVRKYCSQFVGNSFRFPRWWLPCYDLITEFHLFAHDYNSRLRATIAAQNAQINDLQAQTHLQSQTQHLALSANNSWIVKPAMGARGLGHVIVSSGDSGGLKRIASLCEPIQLIYENVSDNSYIDTRNAICTTAGVDYTSTNHNNSAETEKVKIRPISSRPPDKVAQLLITQPLLVRERKFDIRVYVFVRSFVPFEAYMHKYLYARLANRKYDASRLSEDEVAITVSAYSTNEAVAQRQERNPREQLRRELEYEYPLFSWDTMIAELEELCSELFSAAALSIGYWPRSSAYYSLDVMLDTSDQAIYFNQALQERQRLLSQSTFVQPTPRLIEVNFMGDWHPLFMACVSDNDFATWNIHEEKVNADSMGGHTVETDNSEKPLRAAHERAEPPMSMSHWVHDLFTCLATSSSLHDNPRLVKLGQIL